MAGGSDGRGIRLAALAPADAAAGTRIAGSLRLSNAVRDRLAAAVADGPAVTTDLTDAQARAALYRLGRRAFQDRLARAEATQGRSARLRDMAQTWTAPALPVGGRDLARLGLKPGPETGRVLKAFEDGWIADDFPVDGHEDRLKRLMAPRG